MSAPMENDPFADLQHADPNVGYVPPSPDVALASVPNRTRLPIGIFGTVRRRFIATGAASVAVAGAILAATLGTSTAPLLSLTAPSAQDQGGGAQAAMVICYVCMLTPYTFSDGGLNVPMTTLPSYSLQPLNLTALEQDASSVFGIQGAATSSLADSVQQFTFGSSTFTVAGTGVGSVDLSASAGLDSVTSPTTTEGYENTIANLVKSLGVGYTLVNPQVTLTAPDTANGVAGDEAVTAEVAVDGHTITNLEVSADFNVQGQLMSFSAPAFTTQKIADLSTPSASDVVTSLNSEADQARQQLQANNAESESGVSTGESGANVTTTTTPPLTTVTLNSAQLEWYLSALADGSVALIPVYVITGSSQDGQTQGLSWILPAINSSDIQVSPTWEPYWFRPWGSPIMYAQAANSPVGSLR